MATFGAALRDPEIFEDPESFRLDRERKEKKNQWDDMNDFDSWVFRKT